MLTASLVALTALTSSAVQARPLWTRATSAGDFGKCSVPQIEFAAGLDGRSETAFQAVDQTSYNHGSADNIAVITSFICQQLGSACGADATAQSTCTTATNAANAAAAQTGAQADTFNAAFGIKTSFASVTPINDQGQPVVAAASAASTSASAAASSAASTSVDCVTAVTVTAIVTETATASAAASTDDSAVCAATVTVMATVTAGAADTASTTAATSTASAAVASSTASSSSIGDFGSCTVPQIKFGVGFDNRKETSFEPVDQVSYDHGSAQGIDIITQFICDTLTNSCGADATAKATCAQASAAADTVTAKTGGQADAFNAVFGINTDFAAVASVDDQGNIIAGTGSSSAVASSAVTSTAASAASTSAAASTTVNNAAVATSSAAASSSGIGNFGSCTVPQIQFGVGFDNRKETSFEPVDQTSYNHGSAQNIDIITQFICDTLTNSCGADATAKATCAQATAAADTATAKTGAQADAFNAVFGINTDFASVAVVSDTGVTISPGAASATVASVAAATSATSVAATTTAAATSTSAAAAAASSSAAATSGQNLQTFTGSLGATAPTVFAIGNGQFQVTGNSAFNSEQNALVRSCDVQHNQCANAANASGNTGDLTVDACGTQQTQCNAAATA